MSTCQPDPCCCALVVDDDADIGEMISLVLESVGCSTVCAANGQQAMELLRGGLRPRLILLDLMMPIMNGWQFRAEQQRDPELARIPVIVLTGDDRAADKASSLAVQACLKKPVELDDLLAEVKRYCWCKVPES